MSKTKPRAKVQITQISFNPAAVGTPPAAADQAGARSETSGRFEVQFLPVREGPEEENFFVAAAPAFTLSMKDGADLKIGGCYYLDLVPAD